MAEIANRGLMTPTLFRILTLFWIQRFFSKNGDESKF